MRRGALSELPEALGSSWDNLPALLVTAMRVRSQSSVARMPVLESHLTKGVAVF